MADCATEFCYSTESGGGDVSAVFNADLIRRVERDEVRGLAGYCERFSQLHGTVGRGVLRGEGWAVVVLGQDLPINRAIGVGNDTEPTLEQIERAEQFMRGLGVTPEIEATDVTRERLAGLLEPRGYCADKEFTWYVKSAETPVIEIPGEIQIDEAPEPRFWALLNSCGFDGLDEGRASRINGMLSEATARSDARCFLARIDGEPAGSGAMAISERHAMLFSASTLPRFRRRGVQAALLEHRIQRAREEGCDLFSVKVEPGSDSERNVARHGFVALGGKVAWRAREAS